MRCQQRGYREGDVEVVLEYGQKVREGVILTRDQAQRGISEHKKMIATLERLSGTAVIVLEGLAASIYRPDKKRTRRLLNGRQRIRPPRSK